MTIAPGTRFGHYEIAAAIGSGGMGEVYRATDTSLKRDVAIKILPQAFADDADRVARFQREAEALAALNHPTSRRSMGSSRAQGARASSWSSSKGRRSRSASPKARFLPTTPSASRIR